MPVSSKHERITSTPTAATPDQSTPLLPSQQEFHQYLRLQTQSAVRTVIEAIMREELDALIGAAWGECSRQQQRVSQRSLHARSGDLHWSARGDQSPQRSGRSVSHAGV